MRNRKTRLAAMILCALLAMHPVASAAEGEDGAEADAGIAETAEGENSGTEAGGDAATDAENVEDAVEGTEETPENDP